MAPRQARVDIDTAFNFLAEPCDVRVQAFDPALQLAFQEDGLACCQPIDQRGAFGRRGVTGMDQLLQRFERLGQRRCRLRGQRVAEESEHPGVDAVGFGPCAERFGEQARAQRVDDCHGNAGLAQRAMGQTVILVGCLEDDACAFVASDLPLEASDAGAIVGDAQRFAERMEIDVEMGFTHVDADIH